MLAPRAPTRASIVELNHRHARDLLMTEESYTKIDLPSYFSFEKLLGNIAQAMGSKHISSLWHKHPRNYEDVNHLLFDNKDGRFAWRPLELIHPALYVSLVNHITEANNWALIQTRFHEFRTNSRIQCLSIPVVPFPDERIKAAQINQWWQEIEQRSLELSLDFQSLIHTDLVDCYAAMYTHSVAWALHTKSIAKKKRNVKSLIGNIIDSHIQNMREGQSNGIPQGSVLMDFIAEMVLGYSDTLLSDRLDCLHITDYKILRYRDDYRIFANSSQDGELILKCLTETMIGLGLKLNPAKTKNSYDTVTASIKPDKLSWMYRRKGASDLQKRLLIIHDHGTAYPNSGSLQAALLDFHKRILKIEKKRFKRHQIVMPLVGVATDIAYHSPSTIPVFAAILSSLLDLLDTSAEKKDVIAKVRAKFSQIPNTGFLDIWLQRISYQFDSTMNYDEPLCGLITNLDSQIWNSDWVSSKALKEAIDADSIVLSDKLADMPSTILPKEVAVFRAYPL